MSNSNSCQFLLMPFLDWSAAWVLLLVTLQAAACRCGRQECFCHWCQPAICRTSRRSVGFSTSCLPILGEKWWCGTIAPQCWTFLGAMHCGQPRFDRYSAQCPGNHSLRAQAQRSTASSAHQPKQKARKMFFGWTDQFKLMSLYHFLGLRYHSKPQGSTLPIEVSGGHR